MAKTNRHSAQASPASHDKKQERRTGIVTTPKQFRLTPTLVQEVKLASAQSGINESYYLETLLNQIRATNGSLPVLSRELELLGEARSSAA
ncbi:hypothetical protein ACIRCZ_18725 [Leifsonia sp. NPDC102414]|uniref:hypothetical protein n=1 Tax=Leifsonia sp. NPDC102414 TaxID=3364124 RepID=UPI0038065122